MLNDSNQDQVWKSEDMVPYHRRQLVEPYRSTVHLARFVQSLVSRPGGTALDVACGAGANILHFSQVLSGYEWTGVEWYGDRLFPISEPYFCSRGLEPKLISGDLYKLTSMFPPKAFDLVLCIQTLCSLRGYEDAVDQLLAVTRGWTFITAMMTDFDIDARIEVVDHTRADRVTIPQYYNVYSLARFRAYCEARGCREFVSLDFEIDRDLDPPKTGGMGSYTRRMADGRLAQFSGPLHMPWKFMGIRMGMP